MSINIEMVEPIGCAPKKPVKRHISGVLLLDKPEGISSNAALQQVKHLFCAAKAGHTGSLDPLANGMLPICFGEATKLSQFILTADKRYLVVAKLGVKTTTGDSEGQIIATQPVPAYSDEFIQRTLEQFRGNIKQIPSMYSALKHQGQPLYKLARKGIEVTREARDVTIFDLVLLAQQSDCMTFEIQCSKGTYIRTLMEDIGDALGCGAHVIYLRRLSVGHYAEQQMVTMAELQAAKVDGNLDQLMLSMDSALSGWPIVSLSQSAQFYLRRGQAVMVPYAPTAGLVQLMSAEGVFLGVGEIQEDGKVAPRRLVAVKK